MIADGNVESAGRKSVAIKVFQPHRPVNTTLLEISPQRSRQFINQGYAEAMEQLLDYRQTDNISNQAKAG